MKLQHCNIAGYIIFYYNTSRVPKRLRALPYTGPTRHGNISILLLPIRKEKFAMMNAVMEILREFFSAKSTSHIPPSLLFVYYLKLTCNLWRSSKFRTIDPNLDITLSMRHLLATAPGLYISSEEVC